MNTYEVVVIGASQAGLAIGYYLKQKDIKFTLIHKENKVGDVWRNRYDSLVLFTPRSYSSLPGMTMDGDPHGFPTKDEVATYLEHYAQTFNIPVQNNVEVHKLKNTKNGFIVETSNGLYNAQKVIVATGPFQRPFIPSLSKTVSEDVYQIHTSQYVNATQLQEGPVLVVGGGNSGTQIATELSTDREVYLSIGHSLRFLPLVLLKRSIFWWFDKLGILNANRNSAVGKWIMKQGDPIFGYELKKAIKKGNVKIKPRLKDIQSTLALFGNNESVTINNIVWATGFKSDYRWIEIDGLFDVNEKPHHNRGVTPIEGLYFLGLPWQSQRGSGLLEGVGRDAQFLAENYFISFPIHK